MAYVSCASCSNTVLSRAHGTSFDSQATGWETPPRFFKVSFDQHLVCLPRGDSSLHLQIEQQTSVAEQLQGSSNGKQQQQRKVGAAGPQGPSSKGMIDTSPPRGRLGCGAISRILSAQEDTRTSMLSLFLQISITCLAVHVVFMRRIISAPPIALFSALWQIPGL